MLTKPLRVGGSTSVRIATVLALLAVPLTVLFSQASAVAAPCNLPLGCGPPDVGTVDNCAGNAVCGDGNQDPAPQAGGEEDGGGNAPVVINPLPFVMQYALPPVVVHTAPGGNGRGTTYAKLKTYLWLDGWTTPPPKVYPQTGLEISAVPNRALWDLYVTRKPCPDGGSRTSESCTYTYDRSSPNGGRKPYSITATVYFTVTYRCNGPAVCTGGTLELPSPSLPYALRVGEMQAITTH